MGYKSVAAIAVLLAISIAIISQNNTTEFLDKIKTVFSDSFTTVLAWSTASGSSRGSDSVDSSSEDDNEREVKVFTKDELLKHDGSGSDTLMLAVLGKVFDVSKGARHYGPNGGYHFFAGKDASRAFVSGDFTEAGLTDDVDGLRAHEYTELDNWLKFYEADYTYVGKLEGNFYDSKGRPTAKLRAVKDMITKGKTLKLEEEEEKRMYPMCNSEWSQEKGGIVYCSNRSGGVERDWVGVPRLYFRPGVLQPRCACIKTSGPPSNDPGKREHSDRGDLDQPIFKQYPNCDPAAISCRVPDH